MNVEIGQHWFLCRQSAIHKEIRTAGSSDQEAEFRALSQREKFPIRLKLCAERVGIHCMTIALSCGHGIVNIAKSIGRSREDKAAAEPRGQGVWKNFAGINIKDVNRATVLSAVAPTEPNQLSLLCD